MKKYQIIIFSIIVLIVLFSSSLPAVEFNPGNVSTWDNNNWKKVSSMDTKERDSNWASAGSEKNDVIKKLASKEASSGIFLGFGAKTEGVKIESVKGFEDSKLKWYTDASGKKVIGDGKTYLDLDHLPKDAKGLEYSNGKFIISRKDGSKITLDVGSTDKNGKLTSFKYDDIKKAKGLDSLELKTSKDSEIIITKEGFKMKGSESTQIKIGDLSFERKAGDKSTESSVVVGKDRFVLKNTGFTKDNWVTLKPTTNDFTVNFGSHNNLADYVSFKDVDGKWTYVAFDSRGKINAFSRNDINDGKWVDITSGKIAGDLEKIFDSSGGTMRAVILDSVDQSGKPGGEEYNIDYLKKRFYSDYKLRDYAQEPSLEYFKGSQKDFLSINGLSFEVGGKGEIEVLRELTGIVGIDSKTNPVDFKVKVGDMNLVFDYDGIHYPAGAVKNSFRVDDLHMLYEEKIWGESYAITGSVNGNKVVSSSNYFVAGRETYIGEKGVVADVHLDIPVGDLSKIQTKIESKGNTGYYTDYLSQVMDESKYAVKVDLYVPSSFIKDNSMGIIDPSKSSTISGNDLKQFADTFIMPSLDAKLSAFVIPFDGENMQLRAETIADIKDIVKTAITNTKEVNLGTNFNNGKFTVGFQNNPGGDPSLLLGLPGGEVKEIPLKDTKTAETATFAKAILESSIRAPAFEKGTITNYEWSTRAYITRRYAENKFWPRDYLRTLWYEKLGKGSSQWDRMVGPNDATFFKGENGVINTYLKKK